MQEVSRNKFRELKTVRPEPMLGTFVEMNFPRNGRQLGLGLRTSISDQNVKNRKHLHRKISQRKYRSSIKT